ncbi:MAG: carbohydrate kinase family protein [Methanophagales archaeon ANME-1-THS]|nr:MAG: carbohydrate kinase family protein [Methanophagales archaeon ANME-1-THS]
MSAKQNQERYDVVVIGDVFCDIATMPIADFPERDTQRGCEFMLTIGGQAGNCAAACASLGLRTALICKTGDDVLSRWIRTEFEQVGVTCFAGTTGKEELQRPGITVSIAFEDGSRSMLSDRGANLDLREEDVNFELLKKTRFMMRAGHWNTEGLFQANKKMLKFAHAAGSFTGLDIGWSAYLGWTVQARQTVLDLLPSTDFLFVNEAEIQELSGKEGREGEQVLLDRGCRNVIVHGGAEGSAWVTREFEIRSPAFDVKLISPTGVGDVFNAGFIYALLSGRGHEECLRFANACAATHLSTRRRGSVFPTVANVEALYTDENKVT